jgi:hypothetical protein
MYIYSVVHTYIYGIPSLNNSLLLSSYLITFSSGDLIKVCKRPRGSHIVTHVQHNKPIAGVGASSNSAGSDLPTSGILIPNEFDEIHICTLPMWEIYALKKN